MPKATCPACKAAVRHSNDDGTITCPDCDEVFAPPQAKKKVKKYDPAKDEDTYKVTRAAPNAADRDKADAFEAAARGGRRREAELNEMKRGPRRRPWYEGPEIWLLIFAVGAGGGLPFGIWLARNWEKMSGAKVFWVFVALIAVGVTALGLGGSAWAWLRRNR